MRAALFVNRDVTIAIAKLTSAGGISFDVLIGVDQREVLLTNREPLGRHVIEVPLSQLSRFADRNNIDHKSGLCPSLHADFLS
jgi:hypothetical protein